MLRALRLARAAASREEVPIGAVAVHDGRPIAAASNRMERARDATAHAEMLVLRGAARALGGWRLRGVTVYVTLEPCAMCAAAMLMSRIDRCVYAARDPKRGGDGTVHDVLRNPAWNHRVLVEEGLLAENSADLMRRFFQRLRGASRPQS